MGCPGLRLFCVFVGSDFQGNQPDKFIKDRIGMRFYD